MSMDIVNYIEKNKIICICRKIYGEELRKLARAMYDGGIRLMEVTFDQADPDCCQKTGQAIRMVDEEFGGRMQFGAGTVLTREQVDAAKDAGAKYIISPNTDEEIIRYTKQLGLVSIPGAMTPSEILAAHDAGADFVKLFPTVYLGLPYLKDIKGPINHVKLLGTGGLTEENLKDYLDMGMAGAGISGRLVDPELRKKNDYAALSRRAAAFMAIAAT
ncbi:MAG: bifunctional 4-hydroxy-2-oxoglutarate aldolase/2-dehydro-3-deoxy-phosphogluconate aldolase [Lawsonibacter sp.]|nr:bifunctional 4-hydroxy-2-oxoglutarate aldolase/2-dehydro-3-deoxy-phosphogluconate aldolase [Lawsonibacter sp.]